MKNLFTPAKTVELSLVGLNGNAYCLLGSFQEQAKKENWSRSDIDLVLTEARKSNYNHLLQVLLAHCNKGAKDKNFYDE